MDYDISEFILNNKDELREKICSLYMPHHLFPPSLQDVYINQFEEQALKIIQKECGQYLNLDQETILTITPESIKIIDNKLLSLPNKE